MIRSLNLNMTLLNRISTISRRKKRVEVLGRNIITVLQLEIMIPNRIHSARGKPIKIR